MILLWSLFSLVLSQSSAADNTLYPFQYLTRIPATSKSCEAEAQALAVQIQAANADVKNAVGKCLQVVRFQERQLNFQIYSLLVDYQAKESLLVHSTLIPNPYDFIGIIYPTYQSCISELPSQMLIYQRATGMELLDASCESVQKDASYGYALTLHGTGTHKATLSLLRNLVFSSKSIDASWDNKIKSSIEALHGVIAKINAKFFYYYSADPISLTVQTIVSLHTLEECENQKSDVVSLYSRFKPTMLEMACHQTEFGEFSLDVIAGTYKNIISDHGARSPGYYSFKECQVEKNIILKKYPDSLAAFCAPTQLDGKSYQVELMTAY